MKVVTHGGINSSVSGNRDCENAEQGVRASIILKIDLKTKRVERPAITGLIAPRSAARMAEVLQLAVNAAPDAIAVQDRVNVNDGHCWLTTYVTPETALQPKLFPSWATKQRRRCSRREQI